MVGKKVTQGAKELTGVLAVASMQSRPDILDDHLMDLLRATPLLQQVFGKRSSRDLGNMLVLREREHLSLSQSAKCNAIFERDHGTHQQSNCPLCATPPTQISLYHRTRGRR
jgi:hypothetical protein